MLTFTLPHTWLPQLINYIPYLLTACLRLHPPRPLKRDTVSTQP